MFYFFDLTDDKTIHYFKGNNCPISKQKRAHTPLNCREFISSKIVAPARSLVGVVNQCD